MFRLQWHWSAGFHASDGSFHAASAILQSMSACEEAWRRLESSFTKWRQERETGNVTMQVSDIPQLLARDGPWRGNYEDACTITCKQAARPTTQASALALLMCAGWFAMELWYSDVVQAEVFVGTAVAWLSAIIVLWQAASLTSHMQDQSKNLFELHKMALEILMHELKQTQPSSRAASDLATHVQREFELEYALIVEYMKVQANGFSLLDFRITRSHALTATTVLLPSLMKHMWLRPEFMQMFTVQWSLASAATLISAMAALSAHIRASREHQHPAYTLMRWCSQKLQLPHSKALVIVGSAFMLKCVQSYCAP